MAETRLQVSLESHSYLHQTECQYGAHVYQLVPGSILKKSDVRERKKRKNFSGFRTGEQDLQKKDINNSRFVK